jgi:Asp-tRNA(Asn)/Glu-tRNA(Gln) amidotransferase C subunit
MTRVKSNGVRPRFSGENRYRKDMVMQGRAHEELLRIAEEVLEGVS